MRMPDGPSRRLPKHGRAESRHRLANFTMHMLCLGIWCYKILSLVKQRAKWEKIMID